MKIPFIGTYEFKPSVISRTFRWGAISGYLALAVSLLALAVVVARPAAAPSANQNELVTASSKATYNASNFLLLTLGGSNSDIDKLHQMSSVNPEITKLAGTPFGVTAIQPRATELWTDKNVRQWKIGFNATLISTASNTSKRVGFAVYMIEQDGAFQGVAVTPDDDTSVPFKVVSAYSQQLPLDSALSRAMGNFAEVYLTGGKGASLGRFVSATGPRNPWLSSPFSSVQLQSVMVRDGTADPATASPGTTVELIANVKGSSGSDTYTTVQLLVRTTLQQNGEWLVDGFFSPMQTNGTQPR